MSRYPKCLLCCLVSTTVLTAPALRADDAPPPVQPGFHNVAIKQGDRTAYIQVKDAQDPFKNVKDSGSSNPDHFSFNQSSPMANQRYDLGNTASSHDNGSYRQDVEHTFITKSYFTDNADKSTPGLNHSVPLASAGYTNRAQDFDKSFLTASRDVGQNKVADEADSTSSYQGETALLGGHDVKTFASSMATKTYQGPETEAIKQDVSKMNEGMVGLKDLPDRALTIDEVRALINHGIKPDTAADAKPPEAAKPLNDPAYTPDPAPAPLRVQPGDDHHLIDDNDIIPPPGMIAHPQGVVPPDEAEPLPQ